MNRMKSKLFIVVYKERKRLIPVLFLVLLFVYLLFPLTKNKKPDHQATPCEDKETQQLIANICSLYENKIVVGELCEPLCLDNKIRFKKCLNFKKGKHVIEAECTDACLQKKTVPTVLKMMHFNNSSVFDSIKEFGTDFLVTLNLNAEVNDETPQLFDISADRVRKIVGELVNTEYDFRSRDDQDLLKIVWGDESSNFFEEGKTNLLFGRNLWSLLMQSEYLISKIFDEWEIFPRIYGSCGPFYSAEYAPTDKMLKPHSLTEVGSFQPWHKKAQVALHILELVQKVDTLETPLNLCDSKPPHFGFTANGEIRFLDSDTVFTDKTLKKFLTATFCKSDRDCNFFDCHGHCNHHSGKCFAGRTNSNLQVVCEGVFKAKNGNMGLLADPPHSVAASISPLLDKCAAISGKSETLKLNQALQRHLYESIND